MDQFDAIVLGGGPGGYVCAIRLGQLGLTVACVEEEEYGGVCLNWGCIPSKALIANAHFVEKAKHIGDSGIQVSGVNVDVDKMQNWKDGVVKKDDFVKKDDNVKAVEKMQGLVDDAIKLEPAAIKDVPAGDKAAYLDKYKKELGELKKTYDELKAAIQKGDADATSKAFEKLSDNKEKGHKDFAPDE